LGRATKKVQEKPDESFQNMKTEMNLDPNQFNEFPDDFENIEDHNGDPDLYDDGDVNCRLTQKRDQNEMTQVLQEYQKFIKNPKEFDMHNSSHFSDLPSTFRDDCSNKRDQK
jgi:hypothetical protein